MKARKDVAMQTDKIANEKIKLTHFKLLQEASIDK